MSTVYRQILTVANTAELAAKRKEDAYQIVVADTGVFNWEATGAADDVNVFTAIDGGFWVKKINSSSNGAPSLDELTDVTITTPSTGHILKYDGASWINGPETDANGVPDGGGAGQVLTKLSLLDGDYTWQSPAGNENFSNADLTATGDRIHTFGGNALTIDGNYGNVHWTQQFSTSTGFMSNNIMSEDYSSQSTIFPTNGILSTSVTASGFAAHNEVVTATNGVLLSSKDQSADSKLDLQVYPGILQLRASNYAGSTQEDLTVNLTQLPSASTANVLYYNTSTGQVTYGEAPTGSSYTFSQGLTETTGAVKLGGTVTEHVSLTINPSTVFNLQDSGEAGFVQFWGNDGGGPNLSGSFTHGVKSAGFLFNKDGLIVSDGVAGTNPLEVSATSVKMNSLAGTGTRIVTAASNGALGSSTNLTWGSSTLNVTGDVKVSTLAGTGLRGVAVDTTGKLIIHDDEGITYETTVSADNFDSWAYKLSITQPGWGLEWVEVIETVPSTNLYVDLYLSTSGVPDTEQYVGFIDELTSPAKRFNMGGIDATNIFLLFDTAGDGYAYDPLYPVIIRYNLTPRSVTNNYFGNVSAEYFFSKNLESGYGSGPLTGGTRFNNMISASTSRSYAEMKFKLANTTNTGMDSNGELVYLRNNTGIQDTTPTNHYSLQNAGNFTIGSALGVTHLWSKTNDVAIRNGSNTTLIAKASTFNVLIGGSTDSGERLQVTGTSKFTDTISVSGFTTKPSIKIGGLEVQSFGLNNHWLGDNIYYNGTNFVHRATGPAGLFYFLGDEGQFRYYPSAAAGTTESANNVVRLKMMQNGTVALGGNIVWDVGATTGATLVVDGSAATFNKAITLVSSGAGEQMGILNNGTLAGQGRVQFRPTTGTNTIGIFEVIPKGAPSGAGSDFSLYGTDFITDATNFTKLAFQANTLANLIYSYKGGTGTLKPIVLDATGGASAATANAIFNVNGTTTIPGLATGGADQMVTVDSTGVLKKQTIPGGGGGAISGLTAAIATNTINNVNYQQEWQWNSLSTTPALKLSSSSTSASNSSIGSNALLYLDLNGANTNSSAYSTPIYVSNTRTGSGAKNAAFVGSVVGTSGSPESSVFNGTLTNAGTIFKGTGTNVDGINVNIGGTTGIPATFIGPSTVMNLESQSTIGFGSTYIVVLKQSTTSTATTEFGAKIAYQLEHGGGGFTNAGTLETHWLDATSGSQLSGINFYTTANGGNEALHSTLISGKKQTTNTTPTTLLSIPTKSDYAGLLEVIVVASDDNATGRVIGCKMVDYVNDSGSLTLGTPTNVHATAATGTLSTASWTITTSSNNIIVQGTGISGNVNWKVSVRRVQQW